MRRYSGGTTSWGGRGLADRVRLSQTLVLAFVMIATAVTVGAVGQGAARASDHSRRLWTARFDGRAHDYDSGFIGSVSPDGKVLFVTGTSTGPGGSLDTVTIAYRASSGRRIWVARYDGPGRGDDFGQSIAVSEDGETLFVLGTSFGKGTGFDWATIAYEAETGDRVWVRRLDGPGHGDDFGQGGIAIVPDEGTLITTGAVLNPDATYDAATVSYDQESGKRQWLASYDGPAHADDTGNSLVVGSDGTAFVTGSSVGESTDSDIVTLAYDGEEGTLLWESRYDGPGHGLDNPCYTDCVKLNGDGSRAYVTGQSDGGASGDDYITLAYKTRAGGLVWASRFDGPTGGADLGWDLVVLTDGSRVVVNGQSAPVDSAVSDITVVSYDGATGAEQWVTTYDGPAHGDDISYGSGRAPKGDTMLVTGPSEGVGTGYDIVTLAFDTATGAIRWEDRYDGPAHGDDNGYWVTVAEDRPRAFVIGDSLGRKSGVDYVTLAFRLR